MQEDSPSSSGTVSRTRVRSRRSGRSSSFSAQRRTGESAGNAWRNANNPVSTLGPRGDCSVCCPVDESLDIRYLLYTPASPQRATVVPPRDAGVALAAGADPALQTVVYVHGYGETAPGESADEIRTAYMAAGGHNVILMDWGRLAAAPWYSEGARNVRRVGRALGRFLLQLDAAGLPLANVHVVGFSLGAHAAGLAGRIMPKGYRIPRITGLDPALPLFTPRGPGRRLSRSDADFVDVVHTDGGVFGVAGPLGHADFYPSGGVRLQPGCRVQDLQPQARRLDIVGVLTCSHARAWQYYAESVRNPHNFPATRCRRWAGRQKHCDFETDSYMGIAADKKAQGRFYLDTNPRAPFGQGHVNDVR